MLVKILPQAKQCTVVTAIPFTNRLCRRRPSFLDDSSGSEDEVKSPVQRSSPSPCVAGTPFSKDEDAWFLESLSESVPLENCRPDTIRFRRNFRKSREDLTKALFSIFNKEVFAGKQVRLKLSFKDLHSEEGTLGMPDVH
ncbi:hypothetical protein V5799_008531 [Amblyomma americanum]|uniref:Uncharacterized protein n=1 Tax=Amblyomma americanum TaxID=6943 RepID=A0AAQ4FD08_AMBAM